jgi:hypothetical protein
MKHTIAGWIAQSIPDDITDQPTITFLGYKPSGEYYVGVCEHTLVVEIPDDFDPRPAMLASVDKKIEEARAEFTARLTELQDRRNRLLALEMTP